MHCVLSCFFGTTRVHVFDLVMSCTSFGGYAVNQTAEEWWTATLEHFLRNLSFDNL